MHPNTQLIENFYSAFARRAHAGMIACYAPDFDFADEVFAPQGNRVGAMRHMLCDSGNDLLITHNNAQANDERGSAH